jgi:acetyl esterase/lipase
MYVHQTASMCLAMEYLVRFLAIFVMLLSCLTLVRPRTGWGRLLMFIPKLSAGAFITHLGVFGFASALLGGVFYADPVAITIGLGATVISSRYIHRMIKRSREAVGCIEGMSHGWRNGTSEGMLNTPWVVTWNSPPARGWQKDVQIGRNYETGLPILADLWHPLDSRLASGIGLVFLHGSGWHYADKDFGTRLFFRHLTNQGHVIADVAYTLAPAADVFGMVADVKRAITWMKVQAQDLGVDANRIVLMGGSAGGQLALLAAYTPNHPKLDPADVTADTTVHAVVSYYGPTDLRAIFERFKELPNLAGEGAMERGFISFLEARFGFKVIPIHRLLPSFLGGTPNEVPELYDLASPYTHVGKHCPPTLMIQGTHDFSGLASEVRRLHEALRSAGCRTVLLELPDTEHGFDLYKPKWSPSAQAATYVTERFLASLP